MSRPRRKQFNEINAPALARWILLTAFLAITGLSYVYRSVQLYHLGEGKQKLEREFASLEAHNKTETAEISELISRNALQRRIKEGYLRMVPIADQNIVRLNGFTVVPREEVIVTASNKRTAK